MFHWVKILLWLAGRYRQGSGFEDALIEAGIFSKPKLNSILEGCCSICSFHGIAMVDVGGIMAVVDVEWS